MRFYGSYLVLISFVIVWRFLIYIVPPQSKTKRTRVSDLTSYVLSSRLAGTNCLDVGELDVCVTEGRQHYRIQK